jgi:transcription elongation factor Elf1
MDFFDDDYGQSGDYQPNFFGSFECPHCSGDNESGEYDPTNSTLVVVCNYCGEEFVLEDFLA